MSNAPDVPERVRELGGAVGENPPPCGAALSRSATSNVINPGAAAPKTRPRGTGPTPASRGASGARPSRRWLTAEQAACRAGKSRLASGSAPPWRPTGRPAKPGRM